MKTNASTIWIPAATISSTKRFFARCKHLRCQLPVLRHLLLTAGPDGISLSATNLDHWLETRISSDPQEPQQFLIPTEAIDAACRADRQSSVAFTASSGKRNREIGLTLLSGGIEAHSVHPTLDPQEFPTRPDITGIVTEIPPATIEGLTHVANCTSTDPTRSVLNGVLFTPEDGGQLVATDGRRLGCCPAAVPHQEFVLPNDACHILAHPDFLTDLATFCWIGHEDPDKRRLAIRSGRHLLITRLVVGNYPNYRQVIPSDARQMVVIPHDRRSGLIAWLRSLGKDQASVRLDCHKRGQLALSHRTAEGRTATMQVPVEVHGIPPVIAFNPHFLADALTIGSTICLSDELGPGICRHPTGRFCVIMPMRLDCLVQPNPQSQHQPQAHPEPLATAAA